VEIAFLINDERQVSSAVADQVLWPVQTPNVSHVGATAPLNPTAATNHHFANKEDKGLQVASLTSGFLSDSSESPLLHISFLRLLVESGAKNMGSKPSKSPQPLPKETMFPLLQAYIALRLALEGAKDG